MKCRNCPTPLLWEGNRRPCPIKNCPCKECLIKTMCSEACQEIKNTLWGTIFYEKDKRKLQGMLQPNGRHEKKTSSMC